MAPAWSIACSISEVCSTACSSTLQLKHQSAEKSTSTVWPSSTANCLSFSNENGCHLPPAAATGAVCPFANRGRITSSYNHPNDTATNTSNTTPADAHDCTRSRHSAVYGVREMIQQATPTPIRSATLGTTAAGSMKERMNTTVANNTKPVICLNVSIHAPGFGRKRSSSGNTPTTTYGLAMPRPSVAKTARVVGTVWVTAQ